LKMVGLAPEKLRTHCVDKAVGVVDASVRARKVCARARTQAHEHAAARGKQQTSQSRRAPTG
jgi:hypothetical protein